MSSSCGNGGDASERTYLHGKIAAIESSVSKLTIAIISPRPNGAVIFQGKEMSLSSGLSGDAGDRTLHRSSAAIESSVSKLTLRIVSPSPSYRGSRLRSGRTRAGDIFQKGDVKLGVIVFSRNTPFRYGDRKFQSPAFDQAKNLGTRSIGSKLFLSDAPKGCGFSASRRRKRKKTENEDGC